MRATGEDAYRSANLARSAIAAFVESLTVCAMANDQVHERIRLFKTAITYSEIQADLTDWMLRHQEWEKKQ